MIHPCPWCGSDTLAVELLIATTRSLRVLREDTWPPTWGYRTHDDSERQVYCEAALCQDCERLFGFNLAAYQAGHCLEAPHIMEFEHCYPRCSLCETKAMLADIYPVPAPRLPPTLDPLTID